MVVKVKVVLVVVKVASIKTSKVVVGEVGVKRVAAELLKPYSEQKNSNSSKSCSKGSSKKIVIEVDIGIGTGERVVVTMVLAHLQMVIQQLHMRKKDHLLYDKSSTETHCFLTWCLSIEMVFIA